MALLREESEVQRQGTQALSGYLQGLRRDRGMDTGRLCEVSGVPVARLQALETGAGTPNRRELRQLARAFRISPETMLVKAGQMRLILD